MDDRFRLGAAWVFTFALCAGLTTTAYWNVHWGIDLHSTVRLLILAIALICVLTPMLWRSKKAKLAIRQ